MEGSSNAVTEQFLANICLDTQLSPVQKDIQIKHITDTKLHIFFGEEIFWLYRVLASSVLKARLP